MANNETGDLFVSLSNVLDMFRVAYCVGAQNPDVWAFRKVWVHHVRQMVQSLFQ